MQLVYTLAAVLLASSLVGCTKPSDRHQGVEKPPSFPYQQSPGTQPTTEQGGPAAPKPEDERGAMPPEAPDTPGTTRPPASVDTPLPTGTNSR